MLLFISMGIILIGTFFLANYLCKCFPPTIIETLDNFVIDKIYENVDVIKSLNKVLKDLDKLALCRTIFALGSFITQLLILLHLFGLLNKL